MITHSEIAATLDKIRPYVRKTPVVEVPGADVGLPDCTLVLKLELLQHTGSFKARGAFANLLLRDVPASGVVAASGGNHGAAVAYAAMRRGVPAHIFVPGVASPRKIARIRGYGAELVVGGRLYGEALAASREWEALSGALRVEAYDAHETLLGAGTIGVELSEQADVDTVMVGVGGGGQIGGIAASYEGRVAMIGVEPEYAPTLTKAFEAGRPVDAPAAANGAASDSLAPYRVGEEMFPIAQRFIERVVLVNDDDIRKAQEILWSTLQVVAEPGGAAAFSALVSGKYKPKPGSRVGVIVCGANTTAVNFDGKV